MQSKLTYISSLAIPKNVDDVSGTQYWSIEGSNVQFTWFEVDSQTRFPKHKHDSEQITYVLEGELFFRSQDNIYKLSKGDCILIPGNIEHEVWTETTPVKAVDAWSPVNKTYAQNHS